MTKFSFLCAASLCAFAGVAAAQTASGTVEFPKASVTVNHAYLITANEGGKTVRRVIISATDLASKITKCDVMACASDELKQGIEIEMDGGDKLSVFAVVDKKTQMTVTAPRSSFNATANAGEAVAGALAVDATSKDGPKINVQFDAKLTKAFKE